MRQHLLLLLTGLLAFDNVHSQIIYPTKNVCAGTSIALSDATAGGTWSSSNTAVATIGSSTGIVTGVTTGTSLIMYYRGLIIDTVTFTVKPATLPILGYKSFCVGIEFTFVDTTAGVWSCSDSAVALIDSFENYPPSLAYVRGISAGSAILSFTSTSSGCLFTDTISVAAMPAPITCPDSFCMGSSITLSDSTPGGWWSSASDSIITVDSATGLATGNVKGNTIIVHNTSAVGCTVAKSINIIGAPEPHVVLLAGTAIVCLQSPSPLYYYYTDPFSDGDTNVWSVNNASVATVDTTGLVTGITTGTVMVTFSTSNECGTGYDTISLNVVECNVGVTQAAINAGQPNVLPNPSNGLCTLTIPSAIDEPVHVTITNLMGEKVKDFMTTTNILTDIKLEQPAGVYLLHATSRHDRYYTKVIIE